MEHIDIADLRRKVMAARTVTHELEPGVTVSFVLPTQHEIRVALAVAQLDTDPNHKASIERIKRALIIQGVSAWSGIMVSHVVPDPDTDEPLDLCPQAVSLLFEVKDEWAEALENQLMAALADRREMREESQKNSPSS